MQGAPTGTMRRQMSVEDIMGSLTKMNSAGGFPRTDSEQAFQARNLRPNQWCQVTSRVDVSGPAVRREHAFSGRIYAAWRRVAASRGWASDSMFACPVTQEFLKRIPSSNSLAAFGSHGSQLDTAAQGLQFSTIQQAAAAYSQPTASAAATDGGGSALLGVPRVASLDYFRQLLPVNQLNFAGTRPAAGTSHISAHRALVL